MKKWQKLWELTQTVLLFQSKKCQKSSSLFQSCFSLAYFSEPCYDNGTIYPKSTTAKEMLIAMFSVQLGYNEDRNVQMMHSKNR